MTDKQIRRLINSAAREQRRFILEHHAMPDRLALSTNAVQAVKDYLAPRFIDQARSQDERLMLWGMEVIVDDALRDTQVKAVA